MHVRFAYERDYLPAGHGELIYETATRRWQTTHSNACLLRMAECYIESSDGAAVQFRSEVQSPAKPSS